MYDSGNDRPGITETYQTATNTSDLTVEADRRGAGDVLIAAGWSDSRLGQTLIRLRGEWDAAGKPRRATEADIERIAAKMPDPKGRPNVKKARTAVLLGYAKAIRVRAEQMKTRPEAMRLLLEWAVLRGVEPEVIGPALTHWLAPTCPVCDGHGRRKLPDAPVLGKACHHCNSTGIKPQPLGAARVLNYLQDCVGKADNSMKRRLRPGA